jgi:hypothetical protein
MYVREKAVKEEKSAGFPPSDMRAFGIGAHSIPSTPLLFILSHSSSKHTIFILYIYLFFSLIKVEEAKKK